MIFRLRHEERHEYAQKVDLAAHLMHLTPLTLPHQRVSEMQLISVPVPSRIVTAPDCFGNPATWLFLDAPHASFSVTLEATVEVTPRTPPQTATTPAWEQVAQKAARGGTAAHDAAEFIPASAMVAPFAAMRDYTAASFTPGRPALAALHELTLRITHEFAFDPKATEIGTPLAKVLAQRAGVCQDFAHLMIAGVRSMGLPARYASGYIRTRPPPGRPALRGADQSHAWVSCWLGPVHGWIDFDPTNGLIVSDQHVVLAYGRDFADVSPICGIILGGGAQTVHVGVDLMPVDAAAVAG